MSRRARIVLGLLILGISLSLLAWGFWPARRETRVQPIPPVELQLPTPASFELQPIFFS
ncbi:MAG TPA: hypothetical protein VHO49_01175 [Anaerolineales bacterium]|nr:hypothetical protein [Anaerolineales bacterium]HEX5839867.1 hypothetical protein [Anaerolineales bacterium]